MKRIRNICESAGYFIEENWPSVILLGTVISLFVLAVNAAVWHGDSVKELYETYDIPISRESFNSLSNQERAAVIVMSKRREK